MEHALDSRPPAQVYRARVLRSSPGGGTRVRFTRGGQVGAGPRNAPGSWASPAQSHTDVCLALEGVLPPGVTVRLSPARWEVT